MIDRVPVEDIRKRIDGAEDIPPAPTLYNDVQDMLEHYDELQSKLDAARKHVEENDEGGPWFDKLKELLT